MKTIQKIIDVNAHIENLKCEIGVENGIAVARISFDNIGIGNITAIKFIACGYNSFGDIVQINGKDNFFLVIQDAIIRKNEFSKDLKAKLPNADIRMLKLTESQICYDDGSIITYEGESSHTFEIDEFDINTDSEQINALKKMYDERMKYVPKNFGQGWICGCGRFNKSDSTICSCCSKNKTITMSVTSPDGLKGLVEKYHRQEDEERELSRKQAEQEAQVARNRKIGIVIAVVCAIAMISLIIHSSEMSKRMIFDSESDMKRALQGTFICYYDEDSIRAYEAKYKINITKENLTFRWVNLGSDQDHKYEILEYYPDKGQFNVYIMGIITVLSNGNLKDNEGYVYEKVEGWSAASSDWSQDNSSSRRETVYSALKISNISVTSDSRYTICTGTITNNGEKTYEHVKIKGSFRNLLGDEVDTFITYAIGSKGLAPGESISFRMPIRKNSDVKECSVYIYDDY